MTDKRDPSSDLAFDLLTGGLRMGANEQRVGDPADAEQVYGAYLSLLYAVRGARRGEEIPLRSADLDFLLAVVGEDPEQIESRLIELMGCTEEEASLLRRVLVRHRAVAASVGVVASLSLVALFGPAVASATSAPTAPVSPAPAAVVPADPTELPPLTSYLTTDDGEHVPVPEAWDEQPAAAEPAPVETVTVATVPAPAAVASSSSLAAAAVNNSSTTAPPPVRVAALAPVTPSSTTTPAEPLPAEPAKEVVLGEPMTPIDRPGWYLEDEVVLGEPMAPIDRPGEVVMGEPMAPIDRAETGSEEPAVE